MARKRITIDEEIERQKEVVFRLKDKYDAALAELDRLQQKRIELQSKELMKAIEKSGRSYEEILAFLSNSEEE